MASNAYNLRSRVNSPANARVTPTNTPSSKTLLVSSYKPQHSPIALQLDHVIGTTTKGSSGLSSCASNSTFAYCAGSVAVLAQVDEANKLSHRYYRARPAAIAINSTTSYYATPTSTPTRRRTTLITTRKELDASTPGRALPEDENAKTWTARERIKSVKCVSLSPNGRLLAVGENGYNPRVLLFSTTKDAATETPLSIITEHTWGVKCVAFSPDSRLLATLGESNDGFLFIWSVNPRSGAVKLCATNKCTTNVCHMTWCDQRLITVGTRHVKVWHMSAHDRSSPGKRSRLRSLIDTPSAISPTPLAGRNCLLGSLVDETFTCAVTISDQHVLVCTDNGSLCLVDLSKSAADLSILEHDSLPAGPMGFRENHRRLVWAGGGGQLQEIDVDVLLQQRNLSPGRSRSDVDYFSPHNRQPKRSALRQSLGLSQLLQTGVIAISCLKNHHICIDNDANLILSSSAATENVAKQEPLSSQNGPVQGVQTLHLALNQGAFFTWSKNGEVCFWSRDARLLRVEQIELEEGSDVEDAASNELKVLRHSANGLFLSGDRYGVLKLIRCDQWNLLNTYRAHSAEVNDICSDSDSTFVATCSRDRMVQVFKLGNDTLELLQTTDDHIAAVNQVMFSRDDNALLSCSSDRTIVVREKATREYGRDTMVAFLQTRIVTIKASPLSMCLVPGNDDILYVSALDKHITKVDFITGTIMESFKVADPDSDDHAVLNAIKVTTSLETGSLRVLLIGCSSTDKSVRVYDLQKQSMLSKESAHTEGISDLAMLGHSSDQGLTNHRTFVSTGYDGTIMVWTVVPNLQLALTPAIELTMDQASLGYNSDNVPVKASPATLPPLRKVLTKVDIAEFVKGSSPRSPSLRDPSPARLKKKGSRLALASSAIEEADENTPPVLTRRASADDRRKSDLRSPSPPPYATTRHKKPQTRGEISKDFFSRQSEWLRRSPSPETTPLATKSKPELKANKARLRRPPSVPTDLRGTALAQERRSSTISNANEFGSINMASEQACRMLRTYKTKLQTANGNLDLKEIEGELESVLEIVKRKRSANGVNGTGSSRKPLESVPRLKRHSSMILRSSTDRKQSTSSNTGSETSSPTSGNTSARKFSSDSIPKTHTIRSAGGAGFGVEGLSILLEKTKLTEA